MSDTNNADETVWDIFHEVWDSQGEEPMQPTGLTGRFLNFLWLCGAITQALAQEAKVEIADWWRRRRS
jgi:hypothetical protein